MKNLYLIAAGLFLFVAIVIAFANVSARASYYVFFTMQSQSLTIPFFMMLGLGVVAGFLLGMYFSTKVSDVEEGNGDDNLF